MKNEVARIPNVLPAGVLEPIENDELIIAKVQYDSTKTSSDLTNATERGAKNGKRHK